MERLPRFSIILMGLLLGWYGCNNTTEPEKQTGSFNGTVIGVQTAGAVPVSHAYIIAGEDLLAISNEDGAFAITAIEEGNYQMICSALFYADTILNVMIEADRTTNQNFSLVPDSADGRVYGEFQDEDLWIQMLNDNPYLANWEADSVWAGVTGATLQTKTLGFLVPDRTVTIEDSLLAYSDGFGQYWFKIPNGTYPFTGKCDGYQNVTKIVTVPADDRVYLNFVLPRE